MSQDIGKILLAKTDTIVENWIETIRENIDDIESARGLTYQSVRNSIPVVLKALATLLTQSLSDRPEKLENKGLEHGVVRAEQGYDITKILQEYSILRQIIFSVLKPNLLSCSGEHILHTVELINSLIDRVVSLSLESYFEARVQELKHLQNQLILTNQELKRLVASQKEDLSHLAHELKTPLNSIIGFSSLLLQKQRGAFGESDSTYNLQLIDKVIVNGRQLLRLINDTLEMSRYDAGKMELNLKSTDVRSLIRLVAEALESSARMKNLEVILDCDRAPETVVTDPLRLKQIVTNLASNAIRYTESGTIKITCQTEDDDRWSLVVADTGIGISLEARSQIFEPYFRAGSKDSYSPSSTGLGLAIVDKLVNLLQGKIDLVSNLGEGSTFTVTFPMEVVLPT